MILAYSTKPIRPESMAWWWFRDSSQLPSITAEGKMIDWHMHRADSQGTAWHQFGDWNFTHCESPAIMLLRNFESLPCACVNLGWPTVAFRSIRQAPWRMTGLSKFWFRQPSNPSWHQLFFRPEAWEEFLWWAVLLRLHQPCQQGHRTDKCATICSIGNSKVHICWLKLMWM